MQVLFDSSTPYFNLVQVLVQDLLLQSLLKVMTPLEDVRRCYVQYIYIKKYIYLLKYVYIYSILYNLIL